MKLNFFIFTLFNLLKVFKTIEFDLIKNSNLEYENNIYYNEYYHNIKDYFFGNQILSEGKWDLIVKIFYFIKQHTNSSNLIDEELVKCALSILNEKTKNTSNYLITLGYSGKDFSDLGLEHECLRNNFNYYLITYEFINGSVIRNKIQTNSFKFFQQLTFYTGLCLPKKCSSSLQFLFNRTVDSALYKFLLENMNIRNMRVYTIENKNNTFKKDPTITYNYNGTYSEEKTKNEYYKFIIFKYFFNITLLILLLQFVISIILYIFCKPILNAMKLRKQKIKEKEEESSEILEENSTGQLFREIKFNREKENACSEKIFEIIKYFSLLDNIKFLSKNKNDYFDSINLDTIAYLRIITMILMIFINNFEVLIKIPAQYFFYEPFYTRYYTFILKFSSFSVDIWLSLDGFETIYKLINYYKKYELSKKGKGKTFIYLLKFYLSSIYKYISFFILFILVNYLTKYFIYSFARGALFEYYSNHIYNNRLVNEKMFEYLIPGYSLYYFYKNKCSIHGISYISKFSLIFINEVYAYTLFLIIFYLSYLFKRQIFDYLILIINFVIYVANFWLIEFKESENENGNVYYSYKLVFDNFATTRYPHIVFNFFFLGAMSGLICFYDSDISSSNSICNGDEKIPFKFCFDLVKFYDYLIEKGRKIWIILLILLQILISYSFYFLVKNNNNSIDIPFENIQKFVLSYESGLFVFLFCNIMILVTLIRKENEGKEKYFSSLTILIDRISFSFFQTINLFMYTFYCFFNFQVELSIQNLFFVTFSLFILVLASNLMLTLAIVLPLKIINKKILKNILKEKINEEKSRKISEDSSILQKSIISDINNSIIKE